MVGNSGQGDRDQPVEWTRAAGFGYGERQPFKSQLYSVCQAGQSRAIAIGGRIIGGVERNQYDGNDDARADLCRDAHRGEVHDGRLLVVELQNQRAIQWPRQVVYVPRQMHRRGCTRVAALIQVEVLTIDGGHARS